MYQLWNSCVSPQWTFIGFLWRLGESLRVLSGEFQHVEKISERAKGFQTSKGTLRFSPDKPMPVALVKKLVKARIAENKD
jgi:hypothetical protein